jgi:hypothetical protein
MIVNPLPHPDDQEFAHERRDRRLFFVSQPDQLVVFMLTQPRTDGRAGFFGPWPAWLASRLFLLGIPRHEFYPEAV